MCDEYTTSGAHVSQQEQQESKELVYVRLLIFRKLELIVMNPYLVSVLFTAFLLFLVLEKIQ